jgi:8-oxo-dGTP diphosphatase
MISVSAIIKNSQTNQYLIMKNPPEDGNEGNWVFVSGRLKQGEDIQEGLKREVLEETGIKELNIESLLYAWHGYRGKKTPENELVILTHLCITTETDITLSDEHIAFLWCTKEECLSKINPKIKELVANYLQ